ncbi:MAG: hypothetical protein M3256_26275 [Actinomycetota bacterium]|nr:hypothetical protein [Actinomycetota bacterium]
MTVALVLVGAACSTGGTGSAHPVPPTTTSTVPAVTTTTLDPTSAAILAAYRAHWDDVIAVDTVFPVLPLDPRIGNHAIGKQLTSERAALAHLNLVGHYEKGSTEFSPVITSISGDIATLSDCILDHAVEYDKRTDMPVEAADVGHTLDIFTLNRVKGVWYVSDSTVIKSGKTGDACAPSAG